MRREVADVRYNNLNFMQDLVLNQELWDHF